MKVSLIIPSFNENDRILPVITAAQNCRLIDEIVVVDDGSDSNSQKILQQIRGIKLITHPRNQGKTAALKTGVLNSGGEIIAFIDADLTGLQPAQLESLISPVINGQADITLSQRDREFWKIFDSGFVIAFTGDRCFPKKLLVDNIDIFDASGYLFEASFNRRFFNSSLRIFQVPFTGVSHHPKCLKTNLFHGLINDSKMALNIARYLGPRRLFSQVSFARNLTISSSPCLFSGISK